MFTRARNGEPVEGEVILNISPRSISTENNSRVELEFAQCGRPLPLSIGEHFFKHEFVCTRQARAQTRRQSMLVTVRNVDALLARPSRDSSALVAYSEGRGAHRAGARAHAARVLLQLERLSGAS